MFKLKKNVDFKASIIAKSYSGPTYYIIENFEVIIDGIACPNLSVKTVGVGIVFEDSKKDVVKNFIRGYGQTIYEYLNKFNVKSYGRIKYFNSQKRNLPIFTL